MTERQLKEAAAGFFRAHGFDVCTIPEGPTPTPDLLATSDHRFLIEIKSKCDDSVVVSDRASRLSAGEVVDAATPFTPQNTISRIIKKGSEQLAAFPPSQRDFCILWLIALGADAEGQCEQFRGTLYGLANLVGPDTQHATPCYYFRHSAFYRWRAILDSAIVSTGQNHQLCLNTFSPRAPALRQSALGMIFGSAVVDPMELERGGRAYVADCEGERNDETVITRYVQRKYQRPALMTLDVGTLTAYLEIDVSGNEGD